MLGKNPGNIQNPDFLLVLTLMLFYPIPHITQPRIPRNQFHNPPWCIVNGIIIRDLSVSPGLLKFLHYKFYAVHHNLGIKACQNNCPGILCFRTFHWLTEWYCREIQYRWFLAYRSGVGQSTKGIHLQMNIIGETEWFKELNNGINLNLRHCFQTLSGAGMSRDNDRNFIIFSKLVENSNNLFEIFRIVNVFFTMSRNKKVFVN